MLVFILQMDKANEYRWLKESMGRIEQHLANLNRLNNIAAEITLMSNEDIRNREVILSELSDILEDEKRLEVESYTLNINEVERYDRL